MVARLPLMGVAVLALFAALPVQSDDKRVAVPAIDFLIDTPTRQVHVRLHIEMDGQPLEESFRASHKEQLRALFPYLDRNNDGTLDENEARGLPLPMFRLPESDSSQDVHVAYNFRALDLDGDNKVTPAELAGYYEEFEGGAFITRTPPLSPFARGNLDAVIFNLLDTNNDGKLSREEMAKAANTLAKLDKDGDELITLIEAAPQQVPRVNPGEELLVMQAAQPARSPISLDPQRLKAFQTVTPDLELRVRLGDRKGDADIVEVIRPRDKDALFSALRKADGELLLSLDKVRVEFRFDRSRLTTRSMTALREHALRNFRTTDANGDGSVDANESKRSPFMRELFPILDRQGTGKVSDVQMRDYCDKALALQVQTMARRVSLVSSRGDMGLWDILDRNRDGMLGLREVRSAAAVLASLDRNGDGVIDRDEVPTLFVLQLGVGQTDYRRLSGDDVVAFKPDGRLTYVSGEAGGGPLWFRKMDRNGDGDISKTEFFGTPEDFKKLDLDGDGLISREEAERFQRR